MKLDFLLPTQSWAVPVGLALLHSLWQCSVIGGLYAVILKVRRDAEARERYALSCGALFLMALAPIVTAGWFASTPSILPAGDGIARWSSPLNTVTPAPVSSNGVTSPAPGWIQWLVISWLLGVIVFAMRLVGGWWHLRRFIGRDTSPVEPEWQVRLIGLQARLGIRYPVILLESIQIRGPIVIGWLRPFILLPVGFLTGMPMGQVDAILLHELAHIRRFDYLVNLIQRAVEACLFYHPMVWWISQQIRQEREHCCDDLAASALGEGHTLANALLTLAERAPVESGFALAASSGSVAGRVRRLLNFSGPEDSAGSRFWRWAVASVIGAGVIALGFLTVPRLMAPKLFQSVARLRVEGPTLAQPPMEGALSTSPGYDPYFATTQAFRILSSQNLLHIANRMELAKRWHLKGPEEACARLRERVRVTPFRNTSILEIRAASEDPVEAKEIANDLAGGYMAAQKALRESALDGLRQQTERELELFNDQLSNAQRRLFAFLAAGPEPSPEKDPSGEAQWIAQHEEFVDEVRAIRELKSRKRREQLDRDFKILATAGPSAEVLQWAEPQTRPEAWRPGSSASSTGPAF